MLESVSDQPMRLAGRTLDKSRHICAFFHSKEERDKVLMPFFKERFDRGEKIFHIVNPGDRESHLCGCHEWGMVNEDDGDDERLDVQTWEDAYLRGGNFNAERMISFVQDVLERNRKTHGLTCAMGVMEWALEDAPGVTDIIEYEARLNDALYDLPDPIICVYDLNRHSGSVVMDILRTHPMVIVGGILQENPLYVPPDEFLKELSERRH